MKKIDNLIIECNNFLKENEFDYAFCGGHAIDIYLGYKTRSHGDIDISAYWIDRNKIINFMKSNNWIVYEAMGGGKIHLIDNIDDQKLVKMNIFCVKGECIFFHTKLIENNVYECEIDHIEQNKLDYIEFLFNECIDNEFIYSRNNSIRYDLNKAILHKNGLKYFSPELVLLYKSTDLSREENIQDFNKIFTKLPNESRDWLKNALITIYSNDHKWLEKLR
jgi:hypothetical protein